MLTFSTWTGSKHTKAWLGCIASTQGSSYGGEPPLQRWYRQNEPGGIAPPTVQICIPGHEYGHL